MPLSLIPFIIATLSVIAFIMIIECRKGEQAFSQLINQQGQKAVFCFLRAISLQQKSTNFLLKFVSKS